jgi:chromosome segregation protein
MLINARPPGKKVHRLEALSGGEKGVVSMSLIFAIQRYDPSPFYMLDEVDQNLDAINAENVAMMVKRNSERAQFLQISLRKVTLNQADHIIGVTMQKKGISDIIMKVNLGDVKEPQTEKAEAAKPKAEPAAAEPHDRSAGPPEGQGTG